MEARPTLSLRERDRRWAAIRQLLRAHNLDGLIAGGFRAKERYESYITDDYLEGLVVFPLEGEPTVMTWSTTRLSRTFESESRGVEPWVTDYRVGFGGVATARLLREKGLARGRIGIVSLGATSIGELEGTVPYLFWTRLLGELPEATFEDISVPFSDLLLDHSEEDLALLRYAATVSEAACQAMLDATRPGVGEEVIYAEVMREIFRHGCDARHPVMSLHSGPRNIAWGPPRWLLRAEQPRRIERGDMVQAEIHTFYGGQEAQVQMAVAVDPVDGVTQRCEVVARRSWEAGLRVLRPGITFAELVHAMEEPIREAGCWAKTPLAHHLTYGAGGGTGVNRNQLEGTREGWVEGHVSPGIRRGDMVLRPGMSLELEPNASLDTHRVNIGAPVIITETGFEVLNVLPTQVRHVS